MLMIPTKIRESTAKEMGMQEANGKQRREIEKQVQKWFWEKYCQPMSRTYHASAYTLCVCVCFFPFVNVYVPENPWLRDLWIGPAFALPQP